MRLNYFILDDRIKVLYGLDYLESIHRGNREGYAWIIEQHDNNENESGHSSRSTIIDSRNMCYGYAFVVLAGASAMVLGRYTGNISQKPKNEAAIIIQPSLA